VRFRTTPRNQKVPQKYEIFSVVSMIEIGSKITLVAVVKRQACLSLSLSLSPHRQFPGTGNKSA
jgi:hypothetical protein